MQTLENALEDDRPAEIGDEAPKQVFLSDAVATTTGRLKVPSDWFETESSGLENFISGGIGYVRSLKDFPQNVRIFYGEHQMALGGYFENAEMVERGKVNIQNAQRNLDKIMEDRATYAPGQKDQESFSYGLGSGAANYGMMLIGGYGIGGAAKLLGAGVKSAGAIAEASGIGMATAIEASGEVQEGIQTYREKTGDDNLENIDPKFATKELGTTYLYASGSAILEKFLGFGQQRKIFKSKFDLSKAGVRKEMFKSAVKEYAKQGLKTGVSEGVTEMAQEWLNIGIDLADGTINWEQMPERLRGLFMQGAIGAVIGGTAGISAAMYNRRAAKRYLKENLSQVVPAENVDAVVDAVYETGNNELSNVIATELELSSELQNKHGAVYDSMQRAIKRAIDESGAFKNYTEDEMAEYINDTSKLFADQVLAEATQRNVVIDEVLKASDIVYEDGGIRLKNKSEMTTGQEVYQLPPQAYATQPMAQSIEKPYSNKQLERLLENPQENKEAIIDVYNNHLTKYNDVLAERVRATAMYDFGLPEKLTSGELYRIKKEDKEQSLKSLKLPKKITLNYLKNILKKNNIKVVREYTANTGSQYLTLDLEDTPFENVFNDSLVVLSIRDHYKHSNDFVRSDIDFMVDYDNKWIDSLIELADKLDLKGAEVTKARKYIEIRDGDNIYQQELLPAAAYDANGKADINTPEFKNWFGDSKAVDENGRPLKMVHFSNNEFSQFDKNRTGINNDESAIGFWFADRDNFAFNNEEHPIRYDVYLKMDNPLVIEGNGTETNPWADTDIDNLDPYTKFEKMFNDLMYQDPQMWDERIYESIYGGFETQKVKLHFANFSEKRQREIIKGITDKLKAQGYDGIIIKNTRFDSLNPDEGINQYVVFEPNQIKSVYNRGTFDPSSDNIYYQGRIADRVKEIFQPEFSDVEKFAETLKKAIRGELKPQTMLQVSSSTPEVYKSLGVEEKAFNLPQNVLRKINIGKHNVPLSVIENLPELIANPLVIIDSKTETGSFVSVLDAVDKNGDVVVAVIKPTDRNYNVIPSVYGKKEIENLIKSSNVRYVNDIEKPATASIDLSSLQLRGGDSARGNNKNILQKSDIVNILNQNTTNPKGSYNPNTGVIKIFETADFSTLPHELAHYWLDNMWNYTRSGNASEQYQQRWNVIANWLNVRPEQTRLTRGQQEKFARGYEQYLLNGNLPTPMIKGSFDDYDRWLKRVYGDMNRLNVRLTDDAVRFFQSMTTGKLPAPKLKPMRKKRGKMSLAEKMRERMNIQQQEKQEQEAVNFMNDVEAARPMPDNIIERTVIKSNITVGKTGESRVYNREIEKNIDTLSEIAEDNLEYNKVRLAEQAKKADEFVKNNLEEARKIVDGLKPAPENILDTAIRIAYEQEMLRIGDNAEYLRALRLHSSLQTLRGQEISAERISSPDITTPEYWINKVIANRTHKTAKRIFGGWKSIGESSLELYKNMIKEETDAITKKVLAEKDEQAQRKVLNEEIKRLKYEYDIKENQGELFQMPNDQPLNAKNAKMYVSNALDNLFGTTLTQEEVNQIIGKVAELEKSIERTLDETGNPSIQTWVKINEMNNLVESYTPSPALQIATSIVGRGVMLASLKSPTLNIISNTENILAEMVIRRAINAVEGSATQSAVDRSVVSDYLKYAKDVYKYSGYNVSTTQDIDASIVTLGEQRISTQGKGWYRKFARGIETGVFKYLMGYPDSVSKDIVFSDVASLEATTIALNEGKDGKELTQRANELFIDATRIEPTTEEGRLIRDKAIQEANIATYTNDTALSKLALGIRESLNKATGNVRLGDQLMPFVKTPANVVSLGLEYTAGLAYAIPKLPKIIKDVKAGNITDESRTAIKAAMRNGLGVVLAMLIAAAFDPDDYTPEYDALSPSERRLALEKGAVFNSVRIGNKYISLDYLGPLALPMAAVLTARYREDNPLWGFTAGALSQAAKTPGVGEIYDAIKFIGDSVRKDAQENVENIGNIMLDYVRARTIPSIVNDLAKVFDDVERETSGGTWDKVLNSLPGIRNNLPEKYQTTSPTPRETENIFSTLFFGARVKTAASNRVIYEIDRLYKSGNRVTITDVTRSGKLADLSEEKQQKARREFAKRYYDAVYKLVSSRSYRRKDDEQKAYALNKVRRRIVEELKKELIK